MTDIPITAAVGNDASGFRSFKDTPSPRPLGLSLNVSGDRLAVALSDHRLRVCSRGKDLASEWELLDEWRAHDAEILDASLIRVYVISWRDTNHGVRFNGSIAYTDNFWGLSDLISSSSFGNKHRLIHEDADTVASILMLRKITYRTMHSMSSPTVKTSS